MEPSSHHADDGPMKVILGLGNPGKEYEHTRHNVGWWLIDHVAEHWGFDGWKKDGQSKVAQGHLSGVRETVRLVKPQTYMNLSGAVLKPYLRRPFWSAKADLLVIVDEFALPVGRYRLRPQGSAGGHNGLRSIEHALRSQEYARLRIGIAPADERRQTGDLADFVLSSFGKTERDEVLSLMPRFVDAAELWVRDGIVAAMNTHNRQPEST
jgi:PTH1 family peptidyl-tRNA hydrolase